MTWYSQLTAEVNIPMDVSSTLRDKIQSELDKIENKKL